MLKDYILFTAEKLDISTSMSGLIMTVFIDSMMVSVSILHYS